MIGIINKNSFRNKLRFAPLTTHPPEKNPSRDLRPGPPGCKGRLGNRSLPNPKQPRIRKKLLLQPFKDMFITRLLVCEQQHGNPIKIFLTSFSPTGNNKFSTHLLGWSVTVGKSLHHRPGVAHVGCICTKCDLVTNKTFPRLALSQMRDCSCALPVALLTKLGQPGPTALLQILPNGYYTHLTWVQKSQQPDLLLPPICCLGRHRDTQLHCSRQL